MNMCSKCHKATILKQEQVQVQLVASSIGSIVDGSSSGTGNEPSIPAAAALAEQSGNFGCGNIFCAAHRYSDKHNCPFDYKTTAQDAIAKANPIVRAEKLDKI
ncbi:hypothetical protein like AT1G51200 [Hibiscus trionum]|nr:hypothetical protein like AT1G51200 [Hibiscus trionum]